MSHDVADVEDVEPITIEKIDQFPSRFKTITEALDTENVHVSVWTYEPGDRTAYHAHREQEEVFYVLDGEFRLTLGEPDATETTTVGPGTFYAAGPGVGHGHEFVGEGEGAILAVGAPAVDDTFLDPEAL